MLDEKTLQSILSEGHYITADDGVRALSHARTYRGSMLDYLYANRLLTPDLLGQAVAEWYRVPYADINSNPPSDDQLGRIPPETAYANRAVCFSESETDAVITTDDPSQKKLTDTLSQYFPNKKISLAYSLQEDIDATLRRLSKPLDTRFSRILKEGDRVASELLDEIFSDAFLYHATDIHFEPQEEEVIIRFRVDGILREAGKAPKSHYEQILNRIKVKSRLRIDEHVAAQDGSMRIQSDGRQIDMRTSIVPTIGGEKVVIRILGAYANLFSLSDLGLAADHEVSLSQSAKKPFGMIVVAGPTGSGKTTTLYAVLRLLNQPDVNITTIEDPVEYLVSRINQIQVNPETNLTFAAGLRSIVRQDPDIILVGEIRDTETASIAVNAALTGHVLLTTFNANDAATALPRLLDMGVEPFLLSSTLELVVAQRLVRTICEHCRATTRRVQGAPKKDAYRYEGKGCEQCNHTGFRGRTALFEMIRMTPEMRELILTRPSIQQIRVLAARQGARTLYEDGVEKAGRGITTLEEVLRVAEPIVFQRQKK